MKRVLIIDDDPDMQALYRYWLKGTRYRLDFAGDAARALRMLKGEPADLVITDVVMGGMDGETFVQRLREEGAEVPVLVVSVLPPDALPRACRAKQVHFLQKPVTGETLRATMERTMKKGRER
ncbi:MAG: response regulator [Candidatus Aureabacteria bacterium]|nr:response regulator [Candidatus Auribacterota bacterium]NLW93176.1 response regulator [Chlamydiota bacterium]HOE26759.1 response regulator [bacterium]HQM53673.1 response regulator [bacterium]